MSTKRTKYLAFTGVALFLLVGGVWLIEDNLRWISPKPTYSCTGSGTDKLQRRAKTAVRPSYEGPGRRPPSPSRMKSKGRVAL